MLLVPQFLLRARTLYLCADDWLLVARWELRGDFCATLSATSGKHCTTATRCHTSTESMLLGALAVIWLEGALHKNLLISPRFGAPWATTKERKRKAPLRAPPNPRGRGSRVRPRGAKGAIFQSTNAACVKNSYPSPSLFRSRPSDRVLQCG